MTKKLMFSIIVLALQACASVPPFEITVNPSEVNIYEVSTSTSSHEFAGINVSDWIEAKSVIVANENGCTHYRRLSTDSKRFRTAAQVFLGGRTKETRNIYECVDVANIKNVITSGDIITINDSQNIGESSRRYKNIDPIIFRYRELISKINSSK